MSPARQPSDADVRYGAATAFDTNLVVQAGAGTGKTSLLVERLLNAVGLGVTTLDACVAITFTEKAAGELRQRAAEGFDRLCRLAGPTPPDRDPRREPDRAFAHIVGERGVERDTLRQRALDALQLLPQARIDTIHGFCRAVLAEFPLAAGVDPGFEVDSGEQLKRVLDDEWAAFVKQELSADAARAALWRALLDRIPLWLVELAARGLAGFGVPAPLLRPPYPTPEPEAVFGPGVAVLRERIAACVELVPRGQVAEGALSRMDEALALFAAKGLDAYQRRVENDGSFQLRIQKKDLSISSKVPATDRERVKATWREAATLAWALYRNDDALMQQLVEAVGPFCVRAREALLRSGYVGFDGLLTLTRDMLRDEPAVRAALRGRYRMLLVDEFQDTDPLQYEIVLLLAQREGCEANDPYEAELEAGRLFVVGDPKQSIYRFRGADYGAYDRAVTRIVAQGGQRLDLTANFRSVPELLAPVNALFSDGAGGAWEASAYQPPYVPIDAARASGNAARVELWTLDVEGRQRAAERRRDEGWLIAHEILRAHEQDGVPLSRMAVLLRAFTNLGHYLRPLRELAIPFVVDGGREFMKRPEVTHLLAVLRAVAQPGDPVALLGYLRSPTGAVPDTELATHASAGGRWRLDADVDARALPTLYRAIERLRSLVRETGQLPADALVRHVIERTDLLTISAAAYEGPQRVANLGKLAAVAAELARDGRLSIAQVLDALEQERPTEVESDSPLADERTDSVRVLTVHKAKGLEYDVVFLPDLTRLEARAPWTPVRVDLAVLPDGGRGPAIHVEPMRNALRTWFEEEQRKHEREEELRVLYVALTRARERLVLLAGEPRGRAPWIEALAPWGYTADDPPEDGVSLAGGGVLHRRVRAEAARRPDAAGAVEGSARAVAAYYRALEAAQDGAVPPVQRPSGVREESDAAIELQALAASRRSPRSRELAKRVGTVVHTALERWDGRGEPASIGRALARRLDDVADTDALEREVTDALERFAGSPLAERLRDVEVLGRELPLLLRGDGGVIWNGSIDLLYRDADGEIVVADYKTDRDAGDGELRELYGSQLGLYAEAVRRTMKLDTPPRRELWLVREGRVVVLE